MTTFKKLTAFIVCFLMMFTVLPVGAFNIADDVVGTEFEESAYVLGALSIMVGDAGTGNFRPSDQITRAEFSRVAVSLLGLDSIADASKDNVKFNDMSPEHWANGYVNVAAEQKIVIGNDDGSFAPESPISYQDAITILVRALGYEPKANTQGGYPSGFLVTANSIELTKNAYGSGSEAVKRGIVANLTYNALTINLMEQVGFGSDAKFEITDKTILRDKLKVETGKGQVTANGYSTLDASSGLEVDDIRINDDLMFKAGNTDAAKYLGYYVNYYAKIDEDDINKTLILVRPEKSRNKTTSINGENIHSISSTEVEYWLDKDKDSKPQKIKLAAEPTMIFNGVGLNFNAEHIKPADGYLNGNVKFIEVTGDDKYDVAFVDSFENIVVEDVIESAHKIVDKYGNPSLTLDPEDINIRYSLKDINGKDVKITDLKEWDIVTFTKSQDESYISATVVSNKVEGKVVEVQDDKYKIGDKLFKKAANLPEDINLEDEGVFYLDLQGKIAAVNKSASISRNYNYLIDAGISGVIDTSANFKVLNTKGEIKTLVSTDKIRFNGVSQKTGAEVIEALKVDGKVVSQLITINTNSEGKITEIDTANDKTQDNLTIDKYDFVKNFADSDVVYKENSKKLGRFNLNKDTLVFDIPAGVTDPYEFTVRDISLFENEGEYDVELFDIQEDLSAKVVIVSSSTGKTNSESPITVVNKITNARNEDGEEIQKLYAAHDGEMKEFETESAGILVKGENKALVSGDVIQFKLNAKNKIEKISVLFNVEDKATEFTKAVDEKMTLVYGKVLKKFPTSINVSVNDGAYENYSLEGVKVYSYDSKRPTSSIQILTTADIQRYDETNPSRVLLRVYDDMVKEIYIVK